MKRITDRIAVFGAALLIDAVLQTLFRPPPPPHPTWLAWAIARLSNWIPAPRLRGILPVLLAVALTRGSALLANAPAEQGRRWPLIFARALLLASTFDAWRSIREARRVQRQLNDTANPSAATGTVELELGQLAQGASEGVVGPWAAYVVADLPGAVAWAAAEQIGGPAGGIDGPLAALLESSGQLAAVQQARDAIAGGATLAAARQGQAFSLHLDDIMESTETPLAVTAMTVALDRRLVWNGRITGWQRPPPDADDLRRASSIALRALALLAGATAAAIALIELLKPAAAANSARDGGPNWQDLFDPRDLP